MKYEDYSRKPPKHAKTRLHLKCDFCKNMFWEGKSKAEKNKRHFCSIRCYGDFRKTQPMNEQNAYKGILKIGEPKWKYSARYRKAHPEIIAHLKARRYAREKNAEGSHTLEEWQTICKEADNRCVVCKEETKLTKDHVRPLSEGGSDYIKNIQPLCRNCNSRKWKTFYQNPELLK